MLILLGVNIMPILRIHSRYLWMQDFDWLAGCAALNNIECVVVGVNTKADLRFPSMLLLLRDLVGSPELLALRRRAK